MKRAVQNLEVSTTDDGKIFIDQDWGTGESSGVSITADQVPMLIDWLQEAASELKKKPTP